jgi:outer membrane protein OmpU
MKKVLLTTTALVMTAGVAAAEVSFSGTTQVSVSNTTSLGNDLNTHIDFNVKVSGASDNGITMSAGFGYDAGRQVDAGDFELDGEEAAGSAIAVTETETADNGADVNTVTGDNNPAWSTAAPSLTIGYAGVTVTADGSGVADLYNGDVNSGDLGISGSMGGISFGLTTALSKGDEDSSMSLGYSMGDVAVSYVSTNNADGNEGRDGSKMSISYTMGDMKVTASSDDDGNTAEAVQKVGVSYKMDAMTIAYSAATTGVANSNIGDDWDVSVSYSAGALSASVATDEDSVSKISASYDLGGGVNAFFVNRSGTAGTTNKDFNAVGINFAF